MMYRLAFCVCFFLLNPGHSRNNLLPNTSIAFACYGDDLIHLTLIALGLYQEVATAVVVLCGVSRASPLTSIYIQC